MQLTEKVPIDDYKFQVLQFKIEAISINLTKNSNSVLSNLTDFKFEK